MAEQQEQKFEEAKADLAKKPKPANIKRMSQQFSSFVYHVDENDKKARVLGRDAASWTRITIFYIVYYTLLGFIVTFTIRGYANVRLEPPGEKQSLIHTRLDQPGGHIIPMNQIQDTVDADNQIVLSKTYGKSHNEIYEYAFLQFAEEVKSKNSNPNAKNCVIGDMEGYNAPMKDESLTVGSEDEEAEQSAAEPTNDFPVCKVSNADLITQENLEGWIAAETPVVGLALNKLVGWKPVNHKLDSELIGNWNQEFVKDAVYAHCFETDTSGQAIKDSNLQVLPLQGSDAQLNPEFFPYHAKDVYEKESDKTPWNRPFLLYQISKKDASIDTWADEKPHYFSCYWDAQNIDRPQVPENWVGEGNENIKSWSSDLEKLGVGITKFSIMYKDIEFDSVKAQANHEPYGYKNN